jgi:putative nucleotidyltransferase with HDIG domain
MDKAAPVVPDKQEVLYRVAQISNLPLLIGALQRLLELVHSEISSLSELERIIRYDQSFSAKLLRVANSVFYSRRGGVRTIAQAIMVMGFDRVKSICLSMLVMQLCSDESALPAGQRERLWKHAFATANIASEIVQTKPWIDKEFAYVLGLLHDIGRLTLAVHFNDYYQMVSSMAEIYKMPSWYVEYANSLTHMEIGRWMCIKWRLPECFARVTEFHHQPLRSPSHKSEVILVFLANVLANVRLFPEYVNDPFTLLCTQKLCLTEEGWEHCIKQSNMVWPQVDAFWAMLK